MTAADAAVRRAVGVERLLERSNTYTVRGRNWRKERLR